jgi:hypothetical protein
MRAKHTKKCAYSHGVATCDLLSENTSSVFTQKVITIIAPLKINDFHKISIYLYVITQNDITKNVIKLP